MKSEDKVELFDTSTSLDVDVDNLELTGYTGFFYAVKNKKKPTCTLPRCAHVRYPPYEEDIPFQFLTHASFLLPFVQLHRTSLPVSPANTMNTVITHNSQNVTRNQHA